MLSERIFLCDAVAALLARLKEAVTCPTRRGGEPLRELLELVMEFFLTLLSLNKLIKKMKILLALILGNFGSIIIGAILANLLFVNDKIEEEKDGTISLKFTYKAKIGRIIAGLLGPFLTCWFSYWILNIDKVDSNNLL